MRFGRTQLGILIHHRGISFLTLVLIVGCSQSPNSNASTSTVRADGRFEEPIVLAVEARVGTTIDVLTSRFEALQAKTVVACLGAQGYKLSLTEAQSALGQSAAKHPSQYEIAETYFRDGQLIGGVPVGISEDAFGECTMAANNLNSPIKTLRNLMVKAVKEVSDGVSASEEYLNAKSREVKCFQSIGENPDVTPPPPDIEISNLVGQVMNGSLARSDALALLVKLKSKVVQYDAITQARKSCEDPLMSTERTLVSTGQEKFLKDNPGWLEGIADAYKSEIKKIFATE